MIVRLLITNFSVCLDPLSRSGRLFLTFRVNGHSFYDNNGDNGFWVDLSGTDVVRDDDGV